MAKKTEGAVAQPAIVVLVCKYSKGMYPKIKLGTSAGVNQPFLKFNNGVCVVSQEDHETIKKHPLYGNDFGLHGEFEGTTPATVQVVRGPVSSTGLIED